MAAVPEVARTNRGTPEFIIGMIKWAKNLAPLFYAFALFFGIIRIIFAGLETSCKEAVTFVRGAPSDKEVDGLLNKEVPGGK